MMRQWAPLAALFRRLRLIHVTEVRRSARRPGLRVCWGGVDRRNRNRRPGPYISHEGLPWTAASPRPLRLLDCCSQAKRIGTMYSGSAARASLDRPTQQKEAPMAIAGLFHDAVAISPEASVAMYSLGDSVLLDEATQEIPSPKSASPCFIRLRMIPTISAPCAGRYCRTACG
jgi:hypothetical protein